MTHLTPTAVAEFLTRCAFMFFAICAVLGAGSPETGEPAAVREPCPIDHGRDDNGTCVPTTAPIPDWAATSLDTPVVTTPADPCLKQVFDQVLATLPADRSIRYGWANLDELGAAGITWPDDRVIVLSTTSPCDDLASAMFHEWAHVAIADFYGSDAAAADHLGVELEVLADCVSEALTRRFGAKVFSPYADGVGGCMSTRAAFARALIGQ